MERISSLKLVPLSFYSRDAYNKVYRSWKGTGIAYLLLVVALGWILSIIQIQLGFSEWANGEATFYANQVPKIRIHNGVATTDVATPYFIKNEKGEAIAIIDLTGETKSVDDTDATMLLTSNTLSVKKSERETRTIKLLEIGDQEIDKGRLLHWLQTAKLWIAPVFYPFAVLFAFIYRLGQVLLYSLATLALMSRTQWTYAQVLRLTAVAVTPVIFLNTIVGLFDIKLPAWWLVCFLVAMGYIVFATSSVSRSEPKKEVPSPTAN